MITQIIHKAQPYFLCMRLNRPIGTLLLLWPTLTALWLANRGQPSGTLLTIFALGVFLMRAAGCVVNDIADKDFDAHVWRTKTRPLATGTLLIKQAAVCAILLMLAAFSLTFLLNWQCQLLALFGGGLACLYPLMKRITHYPQVVLAFAFAWGVPMAYAALGKALLPEGLLLFIAIGCWIVAFDTQYAMADIADDVKIGVKSTAIAFGRYDRIIIALLQLSALILLVLVARHAQLAWPFYAALISMAGFFSYQAWLCWHRQPTPCFAAFLNNQWAGLSLFLGVVFSC